MSAIEIIPIESHKSSIANRDIAYLILNSICNCAALVVNRCIIKRHAENVITHIHSLKVKLDWILLTAASKSPENIRLIQMQCGGVVAGNKSALSTLKSMRTFSKSQFEELSGHQIILLGHIELQVLPIANETKSEFLIEDNLFIGDSPLGQKDIGIKKQVFSAHHYNPSYLFPS